MGQVAPRSFASPLKAGLRITKRGGYAGLRRLTFAYFIGQTDFLDTDCADYAGQADFHLLKLSERILARFNKKTVAGHVI